MKYCPKCKFEYNDDVDVCPDCHEKLVPNLPNDDSANDDKDYGTWVPIAQLTSQQYAEMCVEGLRAKDIPVVLHSGTGFFGMTGQMGISSAQPAGGTYTILVPESFRETAEQEAEIILGDELKNQRGCDT